MNDGTAAEDHGDVVRLAAVIYADSENANGIVAAFAERLCQQPDVRVAGLVQHRLPGPGKKMVLTDLQTAEQVRISQDLGAGSDSCVLDPTGLATAAVMLRRARETGPDLLVISKFGRLEVEGNGFRTELFCAAGDGMAVLTTVADKHRDAFREATGGWAVELPASSDAIEAWWQQVAPASTSVPASPSSPAEAAPCS